MSFPNIACWLIIRTNHLSEPPLVLISSDNRRSTVYVTSSRNITISNNILQEAPKDKLLVFNVKEGWEPLCKFLEKEIPDKPFPWKNIGGKGYIPEDYMRRFERQVMKETFILVVALLLFLLAAYFFANGYDWWKSSSTFLLGFCTWYYFL